MRPLAESPWTVPLKVDTALPSVTDLNTKITPSWLSSRMSVDGYAAVAQSIAFDLGNQLARRLDSSDSTGIKSVSITGRDASGSITRERVTPATDDIWGQLVGGTPLVVVAQLGSTKGNMFQIIAQVQYLGVDEQDRDGLAELSCSFDLVAQDNSKENELVIVAL